MTATRAYLHVAAASVAFAVLTAATPAEPRRQVVLIRSIDATLHAEVDTTIGRYYTIAYALPDSLRHDDVELAMLEVVVDVSAKLRDGMASEAPVLQVYALDQPFSGSIDPESLDPGKRAVRPIAVGSGRRVILNVTEIVRTQLDGSNHGLILGSLTGERDGEFVFTPGSFPDGVVGRLSVYRRSSLAADEPADTTQRSGSRR